MDLFKKRKTFKPTAISVYIGRIVSAMVGNMKQVFGTYGTIIIRGAAFLRGDHYVF